MPNLNDWLDKVITNQPVNIQGIANDSREIKKNWCYIALPLSNGNHGMQYYYNALANGAVAVISDITSPDNQIISVKIPELVSDEPFLPELYQRFFSTKELPFRVLGITGTNGKTSTAWIAAQILLAKYNKVGLLGTLGNGTVTKNKFTLKPCQLTTLDNLSLHTQLQEFIAEKADAVVMEVSSHGIEQRRIAGVDFDVSTLTNITSDHLDYHGNLEQYRQVKKKFFTNYKTKNSVINIDDGMGRLWAKELSNVSTYGCNSNATMQANNIEPHSHGIRFNILHGDSNYPVETSLMGVFQVNNILAAITSSMKMGLSFDQCLQTILNLKTIPGRMQWLRSDNTADVIVDYAHTDDALRAALSTIREHLNGKIWCVFGCGGDRDSTKRSLMGATAQKYSDHVIITDDNPRTENPTKIRKDILSSVPSAKEIADRFEAIAFAIKHAKKDDIILIAGKGHEEYQIYGTEKIAFSDVKTVLEMTELELSNI